MGLARGRAHENALRAKSWTLPAKSYNSLSVLPIAFPLPRLLCLQLCLVLPLFNECRPECRLERLAPLLGPLLPFELVEFRRAEVRMFILSITLLKVTRPSTEPSRPRKLPRKLWLPVGESGSTLESPM